ncbi:hypothetical protein KY290_008135 [Solanum tuberosum]|uniref:Uncharacterized protein n=1 Tax=Solanum tuberosum TaxID=4113 RepID=A0ABQ7W7Q1_SOLTU|nr:hypothetical protein KY290_008135 [Solanum tuberosum]
MRIHQRSTKSHCAYFGFHAIPQHQVTAEEENSSPRILRWLRAKTKTIKNPPDLYNPPHDVVVHP